VNVLVAESNRTGWHTQPSNADARAPPGLGCTDRVSAVRWSGFAEEVMRDFKGGSAAENLAPDVEIQLLLYVLRNRWVLCAAEGKE